MQLFLYTSKRRKLPYLPQTYSNPLYLKWLLMYLADEYKDQIDLHPVRRPAKAWRYINDQSSRNRNTLTTLLLCLRSVYMMSHTGSACAGYPILGGARG